MPKIHFVFSAKTYRGGTCHSYSPILDKNASYPVWLQWAIKVVEF